MRNKSLIKTIVYAVIAVFVMCCIFAGDAMTLLRYSSYTGETVGVVEDVETRRVWHRKRYRTEARVTYSYSVDGQEYRSISNWGSGGGARAGQEITVRFDPEDPMKSVTELDKARSEWSFTAFGMATVFVGAVVWFERTAIRKYDGRRYVP